MRSMLFLVCLMTLKVAFLQTESKHHQYNEYLIEAKNEIRDTRVLREATKQQLDSLNKAIAENDSVMAIQGKSIDSLTNVITMRQNDQHRANTDLNNSKSSLNSTIDKNKKNDAKVAENKDAISQHTTILKELTQKQSIASENLNRTKLNLAKEQASLERVNADYTSKVNELTKSKTDLATVKADYASNENKLVKVKLNIGESINQMKTKETIIVSKKKDVEIIEGDVQKNNDRIAQLQKDLANYTSEINTNRQKLAPLERLLGEAEGVSVETINEKEADSLRVRDLGYKINEYQAKSELLGNHIKNSEAKIEILDTEIAHLRSKNSFLEKEKTEVLRRKDKNTANIIEYSKQMADLKKREGILSETIKKETNYISSLNPNVQNRDSIINVKYAIIKEQQDRLYKVRLEKEKVDGQITLNKSELGKIDQAMAMKNSDVGANNNFIAAKSSEIESLKNQVIEQSKDKSTYEFDIKKAQDEIVVLTDNINKLNVVITAKNGNINNLKAQIPPLHNRILELDENRKKAEKEIAQLKEENKGFQSEITHNQTDVLTAKEEINSLKELINTFDREKITLENRSLELNNETKLLTMEIDRFVQEEQQLKQQKDVLQTKVNGLKDDETRYTIETERLKKDITEKEQTIVDLTNENTKRSSDGIAFRSSIDSLNTTIKRQTTTNDVLITLIENLREDKKARKKVKRSNYEHGLEMNERATITQHKYSMLQSSIEDDILFGIDTALTGNHESALAHFESLLLKEPEHKTLLVLAAFTRYVMRNYEGAMDFLNKTIKANPTYETAYMVRAETQVKQNNYMGAIKDYSQVIYLNKENAQAHMKRGDLYKEYMNEWDKGCDDWYAAVKLGFMEANKQVVDYCNVPVKDRTYKIHQLSKESFDPDYGFTSKKPIKVGRGDGGKYTNIEQYLKLLRDPKGKEVEFVRSSSCCAYSSQNGINGKALVEQYLVTYRDDKGKKQQVILNFSYFDFETPLLVNGFKTTHEIY